MTVILVITALILVWCLLPLPLAVAVGRAFRAGSEERRRPEPVATVVDDQASAS